MKLVHSKNICFKAIQNAGDSNYTRFKQKSVIKVLVVEKPKPCEIYKTICDVYRETCLNNIKKKKMHTNGLNMGLPLLAWVKKTIYRQETHWLSRKENIPSAVVSKEGHTNRGYLCGALKNLSLLISLKKVKKKVLPIANTFEKMHLIYWMTLVYNKN